MNDDLDDLKASMNAAMPQPDDTAKAANLALSQENFVRRQETRIAARHMSDRPIPGLWTGARKMLTTLTSRTGLTVTTAIVAVAFVALTPMRDMMMPPNGPVFRSAPEPEQVGADDALLADSERDQTEELGELRLQAEAPRIAQEKVARERATKAAPQTQLGAIAPDNSAGSYSINPPTPAPADNRVLRREIDTETFANEESNPLRITAESPVSTFSIDVDTASYSVIRNSLMSGHLPSPDAVRIEELVNYFPYDYATPNAEVPFRPTVSVSQTPWNPNTQLVHIGIQGKVPVIEDRPALNLVFLIDTSGSMDATNKLPLLKQSFALMLGQLRDEDQVAIVAYAGSAGQVLAPTAASDRATIMSALNRLDAGGSTAGQAGLQQAYSTARGMAEDGEVTRVILATDGDFNVGLSDPNELKDFIAKQRESGTYLSVLGFGRGNLDDTTMQALAQNGNGQAAYIDTLAEAQKVLVDQLTGALFPIANDVKIQVEFNPATVAEYRLIGYETRTLRREDFNNDKVDAGDIGAGHSVTALYEITPVGSPAQLSDPLRYQTESSAASSDELGYLRLRFKTPGRNTSNLVEQAITSDMPAGTDTGFAAAIAGFGQLLRDDRHLGSWGYDQAIALANAHKGKDNFGYRAEAVQLMRLAQSLAAQ